MICSDIFISMIKSYYDMIFTETYSKYMIDVFSIIYSYKLINILCWYLGGQLIFNYSLEWQ